MDPNLPVTKLKGIGEKVAETLWKLELRTLGDLVGHFPRRYEDRTRFVRIADLKDGEAATILGKVTAVENRPTKNRLVITKVSLDDGSRVVASLVWFNQWRMKASFEKLIGKQIVAYGQVKRSRFAPELAAPEWEAIDEDGPIDSLSLGRIVPVYALTEGLHQNRLRRFVHDAVVACAEEFLDALPERLRRARGLLGISESLKNIHFPESDTALAAARRRLAYEELLLLQLLVADRKRQVAQDPGIAFADVLSPVTELKTVLPFTLTGAQDRVIAELGQDMASPLPMNRLVQGDVGAGKTAVAMAAMTIAARNGYQSALMAPTEILAEQHLKGIRARLEELGLRVDLLTGSRPAREKAAVKERLLSGETQVVVGTHALIQEGVHFHKLGLAVIDEQHRFGVLQRAALSDKGVRPDILVMTATPIPRTLTLTVYGDLDVSILDELPPGRKPIRTHWKARAEQDKVYAGVRQMIAQGRQAYVVCPLVEESEKLEARAATHLAEHLQTHVFPDLSVGLLHGQLKSDEKDAVMAAFRKGEHQVLVATTVIEVGVDVPNASLMVIEHAERFGLSQLHQLRGRVGRGAAASACVLMYSTGEHGRLSETARERLRAMVETSDGFEIARRDLEIRGPGEFLGARQSGAPLLRFADLVEDVALLDWARALAPKMLDQYPELAERHVARWLGGKSDFLKA